MDMTTATRVKSLLESGGTSATALDALIAQVITGVSARLEKRLGRYLLATEREEDFDIRPDDGGLVLHGYPVTAVDSVKQDTARVFGATTVVDADTYHIKMARGILSWDGASLSGGPGTVRVKYTGGMAVDTTAFIAAYPDLATACDLQVAYLVQRRTAPGGTATVAGAGSRSYVGAIDLLPDVIDAVDQHRRRVV